MDPRERFQVTIQRDARMRTETQLVILLILLAIFPLIGPLVQSIQFGFWLQKSVGCKNFILWILNRRISYQWSHRYRLSY